jgi:hypothetical protein
MITSLHIRFDQTITLDAGAFILQQRGGTTIPLSIHPSSDGATIDLTFGSLPDGIYDLLISHSKIHNLANDTLDQDRVFSFHRLFGDADGDGDVDGADLARMQLSIGASATSTAYHDYFDYDGDGDVDSLDYGQVKLRFRKRYVY